ncbi:polymer-forming cytoskeletal protein [uncultured Variovorax sp.]|uniref:bactofilin family protein n=1 Tax=uncultured Variovorax sp. TaxID=114708 RepID=UPI002616329B|nr:polymer-forming cytoskeletal protein [uncultured Variovorax sp.]
MNSTAISNGDAAGNASHIPAFLSSASGSATVIGEETVFNGDISMRAGQDLLVNGCVMGSIFHAGKVVIGASGLVIGSIYVSDLEVLGMVDASQGEILATALKSHSNSHITAAKATVGAGGMSYDRGAFLSANLGMQSAEAVAERLDSLLKAEEEKAAERREAIAQARRLHQPLAASVRDALAAPAPTVPVAAAPAASNVSSILAHQPIAASGRAYPSASDLVAATSVSVLDEAAAQNEVPASALVHIGDSPFASGLPGVDDEVDDSSSLEALHG